jgi:methionyl-tRNA synthetase
MATLLRSYRCLVTSRPIFTRHALTSSLSCSLRSRQSIPRQRHATYATQAEDKKPFYVTTPIFYVNAGKTHLRFSLEIANFVV